MELGHYKEQNPSRVAGTRKVGGEGWDWVKQGAAVTGLDPQLPFPSPTLWPQVLCEHYWPADSTLVICGHITIHLLAKKPEDEWTKREFQLQHMHALRMSGGTGFRAEISEMVASPPGSLEPSLSEDHKHSATPREVCVWKG